ncbi:MAG: PAS domain-containing protein [Candidatus Tectomicrobia bacterium]
MHAEARLHASEQPLAGIIDSTMDAIVILDAEQRIQLFNAAAERIFYLPAQDASCGPQIYYPLSRGSFFETVI